jgi:hypothetical protein
MLEECNVEAVELCIPWTETASEVTVRNQQWESELTFRLVSFSVTFTLPSLWHHSQTDIGGQLRGILALPSGRALINISRVT